MRKGIPHRYPLVMDGGLSNQLESQGNNLDNPLWTAALLADHPEEIKNAHLAYLEAGARCLITSSYQASIQGFMALGYDKNKAEEFMLQTVGLARQAVREFTSRTRTEIVPRVAASIGPYGAGLADGSEYTGDYGVSPETLARFHRPRLELLDATEADFFAVETIPDFTEATVLSGLLRNKSKSAWISFSCKDEEYLRDGTPVEDALRLFAGHSRVFALGVNCTAPRHITGLIRRVKAAAPAKRVVIYPNSGETYHAESKTWSDSADLDHLERMTEEWLDAGADIIGGCCRMGPAEIRAIARAVYSRSS